MITITESDQPFDHLHCSRCKQVLKPFDSSITITPIPGDLYFNASEDIQETKFTYCGNCIDEAGMQYEHPLNSLDEFWNFEPVEET
jgi:hypothetical protein